MTELSRPPYISVRCLTSITEHQGWQNQQATLHLCTLPYINHRTSRMTESAGHLTSLYVALHQSQNIKDDRISRPPYISVCCLTSITEHQGWQNQQATLHPSQNIRMTESAGHLTSITEHQGWQTQQATFHLCMLPYIHQRTSRMTDSAGHLTSIREHEDDRLSRSPYIHQRTWGWQYQQATLHLCMSPFSLSIISSIGGCKA